MKIFISGSINKDAAKIKEDIDTLSKNIKKFKTSWINCHRHGRETMRQVLQKNIIKQYLN